MFHLFRIRSFLSCWISNYYKRDLISFLFFGSEDDGSFRTKRGWFVGFRCKLKEKKYKKIGREKLTPFLFLPLQRTGTPPLTENKRPRERL